MCVLVTVCVWYYVYVCVCVCVVGKPAPDWNGTAVVNGEFLELRLSDFKGRKILSRPHCLESRLLRTFCCCREISCLLFLSPRLVSRPSP